MTKLTTVLAMAACWPAALAPATLLAQAQPTEDPPWKWSAERVRAAVDQVRAGQDLTPDTWPDGARVAVGLSFDFDAETSSLRDANLSPGALSQGEYASRSALPRILSLLDKHEVPATFFVPAWTALLHPQDVKAILARGRHEIGMHGWIHERNSQLGEADERQLMKQAYDTLSQATGKPPVGIRTPSWDFSSFTLKLIRELGLLYDSSLMADDRPYELLAAGQPTGVVELPVEWLLDDYPYFGFDRFSAVRPHSTPDDLFSIWAAEFDQAHTEGTLLILTMHPKFIGHRSRIEMLDRLIGHIKAKQGVWFATHEQIARLVAGKLKR
jgi:peptidoglycan/xylan/chitin deacetylase (PgdA/CDA1 family)